MPGYDGRGPQGQGPMTGRGMGYCNPNFRQKQNVGVFSRGRGRSVGRGLGRGLGRGRNLGQGLGRRRAR